MSFYSPHLDALYRPSYLECVASTHLLHSFLPLLSQWISLHSLTLSRYTRRLIQQCEASTGTTSAPASSSLLTLRAFAGLWSFVSRRSDEVVTLLHVLIEAHFLFQHSSSFGENFFALRRARVRVIWQPNPNVPQPLSQSYWPVRLFRIAKSATFHFIFGWSSSLRDLRSSTLISTHQSSLFGYESEIQPLAVVNALPKPPAAFVGHSYIMTSQPFLSELNTNEKWMSLVSLTVWPYLYKRLHERYLRQVGAYSGILQVDEPISDSPGISIVHIEQPSQQRRSTFLHHIPEHFKSLCSRVRLFGWIFFIRLWPLLRTFLHICSFGLEWRFLVGLSPFFSLFGRCFGIITRRMNANELRGGTLATHELNELVNSSSRDSSSHWHAWLTSQHGTLLGSVLNSIRSFMFNLSFSTKYLIVAALFGFKIVDWLRLTDDGIAGAATHRNIDVPPPSVLVPSAPSTMPKYDYSDCDVPADKEICPLCSRERCNPTAATSGYVFCYSCIFAYTHRHQRCPVTMFPCTVDQLRKIYQS